MHTAVPCPRCGEGHLDRAAYSELLGWYLGDGHLARGRGTILALSIFNDLQYVETNARLFDLMSRVKPGGRPHTRIKSGCLVTTVSWQHWICLFPQHGPGRKHERLIELEPWQRAIVEQHPAEFLRGLFHSDGSRTNNWATRVVGGEQRRYDYPRWEFRNASEDILGLCCWALDLIQVTWTRPGARTISVATRGAVARLDELIGLKS